MMLLTPPTKVLVVSVGAETPPAVMVPTALILPLVFKPFVAVTVPLAATLPVTVSLPETFSVLPLWDTMELVTVALPPLLANTGTNPVLQAVPDAQKISFGSTGGALPWALAD